VWGLSQSRWWAWPRWTSGIAAASAAVLLTACTGFPGSDVFNSSPPPPSGQGSAPIGTGQVRVGVVLPLSAAGNAGLVAQVMKNSAELALAEFQNPNIQLLVKDDAGTAQGAQFATQQALDEGAQIILGPPFGISVGAAGQAARARGVPVIAYSNDANVASRGVYLLSFLPESDVDRVVEYAIANGKRSLVALIPDNAYGTALEAEFRQMVSRKGGRVVALERYPPDKPQIQEAARRIADAANQAEAVFVPDPTDAAPALVAALGGNKRVQLLGTGLWDDPRTLGDPSLQGGWFAAPDPAGFRNLSARYRTRYGQDPVRTATLAYDSVSLVAALVKTQGAQRFSEEVLTSPSGFSGLDGIFRFRADGTNQRGLAVFRVTGNGAQVISPAPKAFTGPGT
jgi:ABC-type branched-subunit amino acid transport system substrate-binding protein